MREKHQKQMPLIDPPTGHPKEKELEPDLNKGKIKASARAGAVMMRFTTWRFICRALRRFFGIADKGFKKSAINANIKTLSPQTATYIRRPPRQGRSKRAGKRGSIVRRVQHP
jgi:hypothetical protein